MAIVNKVNFYDVTGENLQFTVDCNYYSKIVNTQASINFNNSDIGNTVHVNDQYYVDDPRFATSDCGIYTCTEISDYNQVQLVMN